jgi:Transposase DDE domain
MRIKQRLENLTVEMAKLAAIETGSGVARSADIVHRSGQPFDATSGRGSGVVGYNVQTAVDTENHLIVAHEVTTSGSDRSQLANIARQAKAVLEADTLDVVADRGYFKGEEILACEQSGVTVTLPKPMTSGAKASGRFGKQDFAYLPDQDVYRCPAGEKLKYYYTNDEDGQKLRSY